MKQFSLFYLGRFHANKWCVIFREKCKNGKQCYYNIHNKNKINLNNHFHIFLKFNLKKT